MEGRTEVTFALQTLDCLNFNQKIVVSHNYTGLGSDIALEFDLNERPTLKVKNEAVVSPQTVTFSI